MTIPPRIPTPTGRARGRACDLGGRDRGASLIIAIGFVVMIGTITAGLSALVTSSMNNRTTLTEVRNRQYAADAAVESAIAIVRGQADQPTSCGGLHGSSSVVTNGIDIRVVWASACTPIKTSDGMTVTQRNVIFSSCVDQGATCPDTEVIVRAQVNFQRAATGTVTRTFVQSWSVNR